LERKISENSISIRKIEKHALTTVAIKFFALKVTSYSSPLLVDNKGALSFSLSSLPESIANDLFRSDRIGACW